MLPILSDPPTERSLTDARASLSQTKVSLRSLADRISTAEDDLARVVRAAECQISVMREESLALEDLMRHTESYLSPVRRMPHDLLREVFFWCFEDRPLCAWALASVNTVWRTLVLSMPRLWSKVRLHATPNQAPEVVRLWLERSGTTVPLDIEIYLHAKKHPTSSDPPPNRRRSGFSSPPDSFYAVPSYFPGPSTGPQYILTTSAAALPPSSAPLFLPPSPSSVDMWSPSSPSSFSSRRNSRIDAGSTPWGFVALYYLVQQIHRWQRFVFKYDRNISSLPALNGIKGPAPLLKEFDISASESSSGLHDWNWLPTATNSAQLAPNLESLTLQHVPFAWSAPIFQNNLRKIVLRSSSSGLPLNQIYYILREMTETAESVSLHLSTVLNPVIPLVQLTLPRLKSLSIGGHFLLSTLVDNLVLPALQELNLDIDARDSIEDTLHALTSNTPGLATGLKHLSIAYGYGWSDTVEHHPFSYGAVSNWQFLTDFSALESLRIGACPVEVLLNALSHPDEEVGTGAVSINGQNGWVCPQLRTLGLKNCTGHSDPYVKSVQDTWGKLVQAIENRTTGTMVGGVKPVSIKNLELLDTPGLGVDVLSWLNKRCTVTCSEHERHHRYYVD